jgi:hypothetical protein
MARKKNSVDIDLIHKLKLQVEELVGFRILISKDCLKLSELIYKSTKNNLSASTLRRLWGFETSTFSPAYSTIEILQKFVGVEGPRQELSSMAQFVIDFYQPLHFENISPDDKSFQASCRRIALLLRNDESLFNSVYDSLAGTVHGRKFYYELFPDYEFLLHGQSKGYEAFLKYAETKSDMIFAHCILFFTAHLNGDKGKMQFHAVRSKELFDDVNHLHPFVLGRFFFTQIIADVNDARDYWLEEAKREEAKINRKGQGAFTEFPGFHYFVCDALRYVEKWEALLYFSSIALNEFDRFSEFEWKGYYAQLEMFQAIAFFELGEKENAKVLFANIDPSSFYFISERYFQKIFEFWSKKIKSP